MSPAALHATIAARIDRLDPKAKRTFSAAAIAMAGLVMYHNWRGGIREASRLGSEAWALIESLGDATLTVGLRLPAI